MEIFIKITDFLQEKIVHWGPDIALRYSLVVDEIHKFTKGKIKVLDVGSGSCGIAPYLEKPIVGVDIEFSRKVHPLVTPVRISPSVKKLPFKEREFDTVVSIDMLEHLDLPTRTLFIFEMVRLANDLIVINVPIGEFARKQDQKLSQWYKKKHGEDYKFLKEHEQNISITKEFLTRTIKLACKNHKRDATITIKSNFNLALRYWFMKLYLSNNLILKGFYNLLGIPLIPLRHYLNFGGCYRSMFIVRLNN